MEATDLLKLGLGGGALYVLCRVMLAVVAVGATLAHAVATLGERVARLERFVIEWAREQGASVANPAGEFVPAIVGGVGAQGVEQVADGPHEGEQRLDEPERQNKPLTTVEKVLRHVRRIGSVLVFVAFTLAVQIPGG